MRERDDNAVGTALLWKNEDKLDARNIKENGTVFSSHDQHTRDKG